MHAYGLLGWGSFFATMAFKRGSLLEKFLLKNPTFNASNELIFRNIFIKCTKFEIKLCLKFYHQRAWIHGGLKTAKYGFPRS